MKVEYKEGDWISGGEPVIFFEVNKSKTIRCDSMIQLYKHYKMAYDAYKGVIEQAKRQNDPVNFGDIVWIAHSSGKTIACAIVIEEDEHGQEKINYEGLTLALSAVNKKCKVSGNYYCSYRQVGKDIVDGNWGVIKELIEIKAQDYTPVIYIPDNTYLADLIQIQLHQDYLDKINELEATRQ